MTNIILRNNSSEISAGITKQEFLDMYMPDALNRRLRSVKSTRELIKSDTNSIVICSKVFGESVVEVVIAAMIKQFVNTVNVHDNLTSDQALELCEIIICDYYFISLTELAFIFRQAKKGKYGKIGTFAMNIDTITGWIDAYREERIQEFMIANERRDDLLKSGKEIYTDEDGSSKIRERQILPPEITPYISKIAESMDVKRKISEDERNNSSEFIDTSDNKNLQDQLKELQKRIDQGYFDE